MGFDRLVAGFAVLRHFLASPSLPLTSSPFNSGWGGSERANGLHRSSSLQESQINADETDTALRFTASLFRTKSSSLHVQRAAAAGNPKFPKEKASSLTNSTNRRLQKVGAVFSLLLLLLSVIYLGFVWQQYYWTPQASHFSIILDCGSTGTRIHVYEWVHNSKKRRENLPIVVHSIPEEYDIKSGQPNGHFPHRIQTEPGLDKFLHNESGLRAAIEPLLHWAEQQIPPHAHKSTPLFIFATAGLRTMPNPDAKWILDKAWTILDKYPFICQRSWVKIISGVEEAYYGWVALNYNMHRLGNVPRLETFGALDLGGSSLQVTFETGEETKSEYDLNLSIASMEHHLYAYSLPSYGLNDAFEKSLVLLLKKHSERNSGNFSFSNGELQLSHPCLHSGYRQPYSCSKCSLLSHAASHQHDEQSMRKETSVLEIELVGDPDWADCQALAMSVVNVSEWSQSTLARSCEKYPCALNKHQPQPHGKLYGMSGFFAVYKLFNLTRDSTFDMILERGQVFCSKTWQEAERSVVTQPFVEQYCFYAPYVVALLRDGLHLRDEQIAVGSGSITWTLGAVLLEAGKLSSRKGMEGQGSPSLDILNIQQSDVDVNILRVMLYTLLILGIFGVTCVLKWVLQMWHPLHPPLFEPCSTSSVALGV